MGRKPRAKAVSRASPNQTYENLFDAQLKTAGIDGYERQARFIPGRKFRADFYFPRLKLVVEVDGGVYMSYGGHTSGKGYTADRERDQLTVAHGLLPLRFTTGQVRDGSAIKFLRAYIPQRARELGV